MDYPQFVWADRRCESLQYLCVAGWARLGDIVVDTIPGVGPGLQRLLRRSMARLRCSAAALTVWSLADTVRGRLKRGWYGAISGDSKA
jgi:hypothetical protein